MLSLPIQMLSSTPLGPDVSIEVLAKRTDGLSGSDLKEICRNAAMTPVREYMRAKGGNHEEMMKGQQEVGLQNQHFRNLSAHQETWD